jgi:hypothetical protein
MGNCPSTVFHKTHKHPNFKLSVKYGLRRYYFTLYNNSYLAENLSSDSEGM